MTLAVMPIIKISIMITTIKRIALIIVIRIINGNNNRTEDF